MSNSDPTEFDSIPLQSGHKIIISQASGHEGSIIDSNSTKCSVRGHGVVAGYAVNTHQGIVRGYNEDRVSIVLNIQKPNGRPLSEEWPKCSFFGVYDGHGGSGCADFLRDNLHQIIIREPSFPLNPIEALRKGFARAEREFFEKSF